MHSESATSAASGESIALSRPGCGAAVGLDAGHLQVPVNAGAGSEMAELGCRDLGTCPRQPHVANGGMRAYNGAAKRHASLVNLEQASGGSRPVCRSLGPSL